MFLSDDVTSKAHRLSSVRYVATASPASWHGTAQVCARIEHVTLPSLDPLCSQMIGFCACICNVCVCFLFQFVAFGSVSCSVARLRHYCLHTRQASLHPMLL